MSSWSPSRAPPPSAAIVPEFVIGPTVNRPSNVVVSISPALVTVAVISMPLPSITPAG